MDWLTGLFTWESLIAFLTLVALELVLGVDNVIFISILAWQTAAGSARRGTQDRNHAGSCYTYLAAPLAKLAH